ncbi:MAG: hypothetical protein ACKVOP_11905 [Sphingomonadaceae bacterium]
MMTLAPALRFRATSLAITTVALFGLLHQNQVLAVQIVPAAATSPADSWTYADLADVFAAAPIVAQVRIVEAIAIKDAATRNGTIRVFLRGDVVSLIRAPTAQPPRLAWLADVPLDPRGRLPKLKKAMMLLAVSPVAGRPGEVRLVARDAMVTWSPAAEARLRALVAETAASGAVPPATGVTGAFHSAGTIPGEGETQVFLGTESGTAMSISVLRRPDEAPLWSFAPGEIVDEAAATPARETLAWYRLACFLPRALPADATRELTASDSAAALVDYQFVMDQLGDCPRRRG